MTTPATIHVAPDSSSGHRPSLICGCSPLYIGSDMATMAPVYRHRAPAVIVVAALRGERPAVKHSASHNRARTERRADALADGPLTTKQITAAIPRLAAARPEAAVDGGPDRSDRHG